MSTDAGAGRESLTEGRGEAGDAGAYWDAGPPGGVEVDESLAAAQLADPLTSELGYSPVDFAITLLESVHAMTGQPWWVSIVIATLGIRMALLPMTVLQMRNSLRMKEMQPEMEKLKGKLERHEIDQIAFSGQLEYLQRKHGVRYSHVFASLFVQMPVFLTMFWTLQRMSKEWPSFADGGALWFPNLAEADPTYALPLICGAGFLATMELSMADQPKQPGTKQATMQMVFRGIGLITIPIAMTMPTSVLVYWTATNTFTLGQTLFFKIPGAKSAFGVGLKDGKDTPLPASVEVPPDAKVYSRPPSSRQSRSRLRERTDSKKR